MGPAATRLPCRQGSRRRTQGPGGCLRLRPPGTRPGIARGRGSSPRFQDAPYRQPHPSDTRLAVHFRRFGRDSLEIRHCSHSRVKQSSPPYYTLCWVGWKGGCAAHRRFSFGPHLTSTRTERLGVVSRDEVGRDSCFKIPDPWYGWISLTRKSPGKLYHYQHPAYSTAGWWHIKVIAG